MTYEVEGGPVWDTGREWPVGPSGVREAHRAGASLRDIAVESGVSHMTVKRIVERAVDQLAPRRRATAGRRTR